MNEEELVQLIDDWSESSDDDVEVAPRMSIGRGYFHMMEVPNVRSARLTPPPSPLFKPAGDEHKSRRLARQAGAKFQVFLKDTRHPTKAAIRVVVRHNACTEDLLEKLRAKRSKFSEASELYNRSGKVAGAWSLEEGDVLWVTFKFQATLCLECGKTFRSEQGREHHQTSTGHKHLPPPPPMECDSQGMNGSSPNGDVASPAGDVSGRGSSVVDDSGTPSKGDGRKRRRGRRRGSSAATPPTEESQKSPNSQRNADANDRSPNKSQQNTPNGTGSGAGRGGKPSRSGRGKPPLPAAANSSNSNSNTISKEKRSPPGKSNNPQNKPLPTDKQTCHLCQRSFKTIVGLKDHNKAVHNLPIQSSPARGDHTHNTSSFHSSPASTVSLSNPSPLMSHISPLPTTVSPLVAGMSTIAAISLNNSKLPANGNTQSFGMLSASPGDNTGSNSLTCQVRSLSLEQLRSGKQPMSKSEVVCPYQPERGGRWHPLNAI